MFSLVGFFFNSNFEVRRLGVLILNTVNTCIVENIFFGKLSASFVVCRFSGLGVLILNTVNTCIVENIFFGKLSASFVVCRFSHSLICAL